MQHFFTIMNKDLTDKFINSIVFTGEDDESLNNVTTFILDRINSYKVIRSANFPYNDILSKPKNEIEILEIIDKYHETIKRAIKEIRPDIITNYLYKISKVFHSYYAETKILTSKVQGERITLIRCIDKIILNGMKILDIKPMDIM